MRAQLWANLFEFFGRRSSTAQLLAGIGFERGIWREFSGRVRTLRVVRGSAESSREAGAPFRIGSEWVGVSR